MKSLKYVISLIKIKFINIESFLNNQYESSQLIRHSQRLINMETEVLQAIEWAAVSSDIRNKP